MICVFQKISFINVDKGICMFAWVKLLGSMVMGRELQLGKYLLVNVIDYACKSTETKNMCCHVNIYLHHIN